LVDINGVVPVAVAAGREQQTPSIIRKGMAMVSEKCKTLLNRANGTNALVVLAECHIWVNSQIIQTANNRATRVSGNRLSLPAADAAGDPHSDQERPGVPAVR
jgi:hypothetical protein